MTKYEITFRCVVTLEAKTKADAIKNAWLRENLDMKSTYKFLSCKVKK